MKEGFARALFNATITIIYQFTLGKNACIMSRNKWVGRWGFYFIKSSFIVYLKKKIFFVLIYFIAAYSKWHGTSVGTFSFLFLSCAHKLLTRFNNIITRLNDLLCHSNKLLILFKQHK